MPLDVSFTTTSISIGFEKLAHFTAVTQSQVVEKTDLIDPNVVRMLAQESDCPGENIFINATPAKFTVEEVLTLVNNNIPVSISTDAYLPPYQGSTWLRFEDQALRRPDVLMLIAHPAALLGRENRFGRLAQGLDANFLVAEGIPGLEITKVEHISKVFFRGKKVIDRKKIE